MGYSQIDDYAAVYETLKPFQKFTNESFYKERKQFKIKKIIHKIVPDTIIYRYTNLDSLYFHENKLYKELISITSYNFHCPSQEIYTYNENGLLLDLLKYPLSAYLTREDSLAFKNKFIKGLNSFTCVGRFINEENKTNVSLIFYNKKDSIIETEKYVYDVKNKKLKEVYKKEIVKEKYSYSKNKTRIEYYHYDTIEHITKTYIKENVVKNNNIVSSMTYELGYKDAFYIGYLMKYDEYNNIVECVKTIMD